MTFCFVLLSYRSCQGMAAFKSITIIIQQCMLMYIIIHILNLENNLHIINDGFLQIYLIN